MIRYHPTESYLKIVFEYAHSVVPSVLRQKTFWLLCVFHIVLWIQTSKGLLSLTHDPQLVLSWSIILVIAALTTFFQVFFTSQVFLKYVDMLEGARSMATITIDYILQLRIHDADQDQALVRLASRYLLASVLIWLEQPTTPYAPVSEQEWEDLLAVGVIWKDEVEHLRNRKRNECRLILAHWSATVTREISNNLGFTTNVYLGLLRTLEGIRKMQNEVTDTTQFKIPFPYFHILTTMVLLTLLLFAYGFALTGSSFAPVSFVFISLIMIGTLELFNELDDPWGNDPVDFPRHRWGRELIRKAYHMLEDAPACPFRPPPTPIDKFRTPMVPHTSHPKVDIDEEQDDDDGDD